MEKGVRVKVRSQETTRKLLNQSGLKMLVAATKVGVAEVMGGF